MNWIQLEANICKNLIAYGHAIKSLFVTRGRSHIRFTIVIQFVGPGLTEFRIDRICVVLQKGTFRSGWPKAIRSIRNSVNPGPTIHCYIRIDNHCYRDMAFQWPKCKWIESRKGPLWKELLVELRGRRTTIRPPGRGFDFQVISSLRGKKQNENKFVTVSELKRSSWVACQICGSVHPNFRAPKRLK